MGRITYGVLGILLVTVFFGIQEIVVLRDQVYAHEREVRSLGEAYTNACEAIMAGQNSLETTVSQLRSEARSEVSATRAHLFETTDQLAGLIQNESSAIAEVVLKEISTRHDSVAQALERSAANRAEIREVERRLERNCRRLKESMIYPTVQLRGNGTVGSGVVVFSRNLRKDAGKPSHATFLLTAYHVVLEVTNKDSRDVVNDIRIMEKDDRLGSTKHRARVMAFDRKRDIALLELELDTPFPHVANFSSPEELPGIEVFEAAYAVGCPLGNMPLPSGGEITTKRKIVENQTFWMLNAPTYFGNSGGGIYRACDGKLIGVSSMIYTYGRKIPMVVPHLGLFVPAETIFAWLDSQGYGFIYDHTKEVPEELATRGHTGAPRKEGAARATLKRAGFRPTSATP